MRYTKNYGIPLPEATDYYNVEDINRSAETVDRYLKTSADTVSANTINILALAIAFELQHMAEVAGTTDNIYVETFADDNSVMVSAGGYDSENKRMYA